MKTNVVIGDDLRAEGNLTGVSVTIDGTNYNLRLNEKFYEKINKLNSEQKLKALKKALESLN